ncbi:MAG: SRPBCC family protein [Proteobacteria bacterium]|nr:SRPBCC family protein [Pseudomonadota bacterium]
MSRKIMMLAGVLILIGLILPSFLNSQFKMSRSVEINAPIAKVFSNLTDLHEYVKWNPFPEGDPTNQADVSGIGIGSSLIWKGEKTGEGKMTITDIEPEKKISVNMEFFKPMAGVGTVYWTTSAKSETQTELVWSFEQDFSYFGRYFGLFMESMMGKHFEKGLLNFKSLIEASK